MDLPVENAGLRRAQSSAGGGAKQGLGTKMKRGLTLRRKEVSLTFLSASVVLKDRVGDEVGRVETGSGRAEETRREPRRADHPFPTLSPLSSLCPGSSPRSHRPQPTSISSPKGSATLSSFLVPSCLSLTLFALPYLPPIAPTAAAAPKIYSPADLALAIETSERAAAEQAAAAYRASTIGMGPRKTAAEAKEESRLTENAFY